MSLRIMSGVVLQNDQRSQTHFHASGGGQAAPGTTYVSPVTISSTTTTTQNLWIRREEDGQEMNIQFTNTQAAVRPSNRVKLLAAEVKGMEHVFIFALYNYATSQVSVMLEGRDVDRQLKFSGGGSNYDWKDGVGILIVGVIGGIIAEAVRNPRRLDQIGFFGGMVMGTVFAGLVLMVFRRSQRIEAVSAWCKSCIAEAAGPTSK